MIFAGVQIVKMSFTVIINYLLSIIIILASIKMIFMIWNLKILKTKNKNKKTTTKRQQKSEVLIYELLQIKNKVATIRSRKILKLKSEDCLSHVGETSRCYGIRRSPIVPYFVEVKPSIYRLITGSHNYGICITQAFILSQSYVIVIVRLTAPQKAESREPAYSSAILGSIRCMAVV